MIKNVAEASERRPILVVAIVIVITAGMVYGATKITMTSETEDFLPQDYTSVRVTNLIENKVGGTTNEIVLIEGDNLASSESFRAMTRLQGKIHSEFPEYAIRVRSYTDYLKPILENKAKKQIGTENWRKLPNQALGENIKNLLSQPQINQQTSSYLTDNRSIAIITVIVKSDLPNEVLRQSTGKLEEYVHNIGENNEHFSAKVTGTLSMEAETNDMMNRDNQVLVPAAIIVVILILYLAFKRVSDTLFPFLVLGIGSLWMVGSMGFLGISFSMIYVALVPIILGIGIDYTIHMLNRYYEERGEGFGAKKSVKRSVRTIGVAIALTAITTIIGFASFGTSDMPPIRNFGFLAGGGVLYIFALATTLLPSLITLRDQNGTSKKRKKITEKKDRIGAGLSRLESGVQRNKTPILVSAVIISLICIIPASGISTTMNFDTFLSKEAESVQTMEKIENKFGGQQSSSVLVRGNILNPDSLRRIKSLQRKVTAADSEENLIVKSSSITDLILYSENSIPENKSEIANKVIPYLRANHSEQLKRLLPDENISIIYFTVKGSTDKQMDKSTDMIESEVKIISKQSKITFLLDGEPAVGGGPPVISDVMASIMPSMKQSIILAIILVGVVLAVVFRSVLLGLIGTLPVSLALIWEFGALGTIGWPLDVMNMMVSALAIGIGVDFSIHIIHRFEEEWSEKNKSPKESISVTIKSVGRAISSAAATTIGVFIVLSFSRMPPIVRFGELSAMVIFFSLVSALVVLPSILLTYAKWKES